MLIDQWLDLISDDRSPTTMHEYRRLFTARIKPALGDVPVRQLTASRLDQYYLALIREGGLSPASVRQIHAVIRRALGQAVKWGWLGANPAASASPPRLPYRSHKPPSVDLVSSMVDTAAREGNSELAGFIRLAAATGLRRGELCGLRWCDVDLGAGVLLVRRSVVATRGRELEEKSTKTHSERRISLDPGTVDAMSGHRVVMGERADAAGTKLATDAYVFSDAADSGRPWHPDHATGTFRRLAARLGMKGVRLHDLRHMHATQLLAAGVPVPTVSGRLGHASSATTLNVYAHFLEVSDQVAADTISRLLEPTRTSGGDGEER